MSRPAIYRVPEIRIQRVCESEVMPQLSRADLVAGAWAQYIETAPWYDPEKECFVVFVLNRRNRMIAYNLVSLGSATSSLANQREVLRPVVMAGGCAFICAHNHPSGDPSPSAADVQVTRAIKLAAEILDISFLDHLVIGKAALDPLGRGYYSFQEAGLV